MSKIILPAKYPSITTVPKIAQILTILEASELSLPWITNNFLQLCNIKDNVANYCYLNFLENYLFFDRINLLKTSTIEKHIIAYLAKNIIDFVKSCIKDGYYILICLNSMYISEYKVKSDFMHSVLIYGYDEAKKEIYYSDFVNGGKYNFYVMNYEELYSSFYKSVKPKMYEEGYLNEVHILKIRDYMNEYEEVINIKHIKDKLIEYLNGDDYSKIFISTNKNIIPKNYSFSFGVNVYEMLMENIEVHNIHASNRSMYVLFDYFSMLAKKINTLHKESIISSGSLCHELMGKVTLIANNSKIALNSFLKLRIKYPNEIPPNKIKELIAMYKRIKNDSISVIESIIRAL